MPEVIAALRISNGDDFPPLLVVNEDKSGSVNENVVHESAKANGNGELNKNENSEILDGFATNGCHSNENSNTDGAVIID